MLLHATCVSLKGKGVLIRGKPGAGKSDLGLRLIHEGADLVSDDQTLLTQTQVGVNASAPPTIAGMIEVRHVGIVKMSFIASAPVVLVVDLAGLAEDVERLPEAGAVFFLDRRVQRLRLPSFAASTPAKITLFLAHVGAS